MTVKSIYDLQAEYHEFSKSSGGFDLSCWLPDLSCIRPLIPGELCIVIASTKAGKSAVCQNIAVAARDQGNVLYFNLELPGYSYYERFLAMFHRKSQLEVENIHQPDSKGKCDELSPTKLDHIYTCDKTGITIDEAHDITVVEMNKRNFSLVIVDYLGLMRGKGKSVYERTSVIAQGLKRFAKIVNLPVIVVTQRHRTGQDWDDDIHLHSARDSGCIEESAQVIMGLVRSQDDESHLIIKILAQTRGGTDIVHAHFDGPRMRITPWEEKE